MKYYYYYRYYLKLYTLKYAIRVLPNSKLRGELIYKYHLHRTEETPNPYQDFNYDHE